MDKPRLTHLSAVKVRYQERLSRVQERRRALESALSVHAKDVNKLHKLRSEVTENRYLPLSLETAANFMLTGKCTTHS